MPTDQELNELDRQLANGSYYTHTALTRQAERINESEAFLYGLLDAILEKGLISEAEVQEKIAAVRAEIRSKSEQYNIGVMLRRDPAESKPVPTINCAERLHICKAVCCSLRFALSVEELEAGIVKWEIGQPYTIRHSQAGNCIHLETGNCGCKVYDDRPQVCRTYSCINDKRIWTDFDAMQLNQAWIDEYLGPQKLVLQAVYMQGDDQSAD
jgi:Fe-S-cluster containining protein